MTSDTETDEHDDRAREILSAWDIHMDSSQSVSLDTAPGGRGLVLRIPCGRWSADWLARGRAFLAAELRAAYVRGPIAAGLAPELAALRALADACASGDMIAIGLALDAVRAAQGRLLARHEVEGVESPDRQAPPRHAPVDVERPGLDSPALVAQR